MGLTLIASLLLLLQPVVLPGHFQLEANGKQLALIERAKYAIPLSGVPLVDADKLDFLQARVARQVYRAPVNAKIDEQGRIVAEQKGVALNREAFVQSFYTSFYDETVKQLQVPVQSLYPKVDRVLLSSLRKKQIGQYITHFNAENHNRSVNIALASKAIDNVVLFPGETFSFNKVVGERTTERGYREAPVIVKGELSEGVGGGICQVSSTLFNAVDQAGLQIVKRYSHSREVSYVPPGRDATVSWYGPDFIFQNKYAFPVLIKSSVQKGQVIISILSTPEIEYEPREVPGVSDQLPQEIKVRNRSEE